MQTATLDPETKSAIEEATVDVSEASQLIRRHPETIRKWIGKGLLPAHRIVERGKWWIKIVDLAEKMGIEPGEISRDSLDTI
jgi:hypothetical protein